MTLQHLFTTHDFELCDFFDEFQQGEQNISIKFFGYTISLKWSVLIHFYKYLIMSLS